MLVDQLDYPKKKTWHSTQVVVGSRGSSTLQHWQSEDFRRSRISGHRPYPTEWAKVIQEDSYSTAQVFNCDETALYWKKMPDWTYKANEEAKRPGLRQWQIVCHCINATGDCKTKLLLIHCAARLRACKNISTHTLPVHWKVNTKGWMTQSIFEEWFMTIFCLEVKD